MRAVTVVPFQAASASLSDIDEPSVDSGTVLVDTLAVGICGTDIEIVRGDYGWLPPGKDRLVLGHESLGRVAEAPAGSGFAKGDLVVGIVRRPDPEPCAACAVGQWDACRNGNYTEHGIKSLDGFLRERYRADPDALVVLDPNLGAHGVLLEPTTVVAKAWEQTLAVGGRAVFAPKTALIIGAGPIGLLAALMGTQMGYDVHVVDQVTTGRKPDLVRRLGATYHTGSPNDAVAGGADVVIECTGVPSVVLAAMRSSSIGGVVCLTGISPVGTSMNFDLGALARDMVLGNRAVFGSVNANRSHYEAAAKVLAKAPPEWLEGVISRRVPIAKFADALARGDDDVKVVVTVGA
jgi:threonine dehydrogenase-like Zn-dependent dehydrogenase